MAFKHALIALSLLAAPAVAVSTGAMAQGTVRGTEEGANAGDRAAGPVGGVVGGAVGAATGTVGGVAGVRDHGCTSRSVTHEDASGSDTVKRTNCD